MSPRYFAGALALASVALAAVPADEVKSLPGWAGALPSKTYSGHIASGWDVQDGVNRTMMMWYMFVTAEGPEDPTTKPTMLWSNGGPGASSAFGLFTELGPLQLTGQSLLTSPPTLYYNPYAWTRLANVLILNGPAPVGFSYCTPAGPAGDGTSCGSWNDTRTAIFNVNFINAFFDLYPEFAVAPFYIAGESYAGVYVGQITEMLLDAGTKLYLKGIALGDACMGTDVLCGAASNAWSGPWFGLLFAAGQGCISLATFRKLITLCPLELLEHGPMSSAPPACREAVIAAGNECPSNAMFAYNYLDQCPVVVFDSASAAEGGLAALPQPSPSVNVSGYPCGGDGALKYYVSLPSVKAALNVPANSNFESFDNGAGFVYNLTWASNLPLLRRLQSNVDGRGISVLAYNGETDPSISSVKTQNWTQAMGFPLKEAWRPWTFGADANSSQIVAGQVIQFDGGFTHATVRGSGHMVPTHKPFSAFLLMQNFMAGSWPSLPPAGEQPARLWTA